jgi:hypothetical protein
MNLKMTLNPYLLSIRHFKTLQKIPEYCRDCKTPIYTCDKCEIKYCICGLSFVQLMKKEVHKCNVK